MKPLRPLMMKMKDLLKLNSQSEKQMKPLRMVMMKMRDLQKILKVKMLMKPLRIVLTKKKGLQIQNSK